MLRRLSSASTLGISIALTLPLLQACGSLLATLAADAIEDDPGARPFSQRIADKASDTKAGVTLDAAAASCEQVPVVSKSC